MVNEKRLIAYDPITFESFTRHATKHREPYDHYDMGYVDAIDQVEDWLDANTVDAVEVVRCKDCKYSMKSHLQPRHIKNYLCRHSWEGEYHEPDHFCSYGERKDNG